LLLNLIYKKMHTSKEKSLSDTNLKNDKEILSKKNNVDINVLLNRVRADKKKEQLESAFFIGTVIFAIIISGIILSFR